MMRLLRGRPGRHVRAGRRAHVGAHRPAVVAARRRAEARAAQLAALLVAGRVVSGMRLAHMLAVL